MNLNELIEATRALPQGVPMVFSTPDGPTGEGYHVTELKLAHINSIDCAAKLDAWTEATLQLLDGHGKTHMSVGKFANILDQSVRRVEGLGNSPLRVEFAHGNAGIQVFEPAVPVFADGVAQLKLQPIKALCKPAMAGISAQKIASPNKAGCCGGPAPDGADACCVKDADAKSAGEARCGCNSTKELASKQEIPALSSNCCG
jgi:hypothetical protein